MSHSTIYRICLLIVVVLTIIGGIFYYVNYVESQVKVTEGTLVREEYKEKLPAGSKDASQDRLSGSKDARQDRLSGSKDAPQDYLSGCQYQGQEKAVA